MTDGDHVKLTFCWFSEFVPCSKNVATGTKQWISICFIEILWRPDIAGIEMLWNDNPLSLEM